MLSNDPSSDLDMPVALANTRPASREKGKDCNQMCPGPVSVAKNKPSAPDKLAGE